MSLKGRKRDPIVTSRIMAAVRSRDSKAEVALRRALWARGLRFRIHAALYGRPDIVFVGPRVAVFVDGDFWHGNAWRVRGLPNLAALFPNRKRWWVRKIERNIERDRQVTARLKKEQWTVVRFWESELLADASKAACEVERAVRRSHLNQP